MKRNEKDSVTEAWFSFGLLPLLLTAVPLLPQPWSADCWCFLQPTVSRTLLSPSPPLSGCVCECVGRCAPRIWKSSKISQQRYHHLHSRDFLFFISLVYLFPVMKSNFLLFPPLLSLSEQLHLAQTCEHWRFILPQRCTVRQQMQTHATVTLWFSEIALACRGKR